MAMLRSIIPTAAASKKTTPEDVYLAVKAAIDGGAHGGLLSRKYSEMKLTNIAGAGRALREFGSKGLIPGLVKSSW